MTKVKQFKKIGLDEGDPEFESEYSLYQSDLRNNTLLSVLWLFFLLLLVLSLNCFEALRPEQETFGSWLERSGALLGICSLLVEFRLKNIDNILHSIALTFTGDAYKKLMNYYVYKNWLHNIVLFYAVVGTAIWSYGSPLHFAIKALLNS